MFSLVGDTTFMSSARFMHPFFYVTEISTARIDNAAAAQSRDAHRTWFYTCEACSSNTWALTSKQRAVGMVISVSGTGFCLPLCQLFTGGRLVSVLMQLDANHKIARVDVQVESLDGFPEAESG